MKTNETYKGFVITNYINHKGKKTFMGTNSKVKYRGPVDYIKRQIDRHLEMNR